MTDEMKMALAKEFAAGVTKINQFILEYSGTTIINGSDKDDQEMKDEKKTPSIDVMMKICKATMELGFWKCDRSWGVVFQIWQIWGYKGSVSDFVNEINSRNETKGFAYACTQNAVYKMVSKGRISRKLENWRNDGVLEPYCILGDLINSELEKEYGKDEYFEEMEE